MLDRQAKRAYDMERYYRRRRAFFAGKHCTICGTADGLVAHHVDPDSKEGHRIWSWSRKRLETELAKCIVLCKPCHDALHARMRSLTAPVPDHGTEARYARGCRCRACRAAHTARAREWRARQQAASAAD